MEKKKKTAKNTKKTTEKNEEELEKIKKKQKEKREQKKFEKMLSEKKEAIKEDLKNQLLQQNKFGKQFEDMVDDYIYLVDLKERLQKDIDDNGIRYISTGGNGFTTFKPNESCERLLKTNGQMLKILQDLDLKAPDEGDGDDGDDLL